ncbi:MAG: accessory gene regulator B family protein [Lachnospiraceae bacterium]|nr:accessory gene regulator B family protein [Lachnospiraceae bacterium]
MITKISTYFINQITSISNINCDAEDIEVYIYGMECFLNTFITIIILAIWGLLSDSLTGTFLWIAVFSSLRHNTGGYHAHTHAGCIISSVLLGISASFIPIIKYKYILLILFCILLLFLIIVSPVSSAVKPLTKEEKIKNKKYAVLKLCIIFLISLLLPPQLSIFPAYAAVCTSLLMIPAIFVQ